MALIALWSGTTGKPVPADFYWFLVGLTLILAGFLSWRREWVANKRGVVQVDPNYLTSLWMEHTGVQAQAMARPFIGKRIEAAGKIVDLERKTWLFGELRLRHGNIDFVVRLTRWQLQYFAALSAGTVVTMVGQISDVSLGSISLASCHMLDVRSGTPEKDPW